MCFSAEASFTAAAVLAVTGALTVRKVTHPSQLFLAVIPLLFAIQQFFEGMLWVSLEHLEWATYLPIWKYLYLIFSFAVWPFWIPFSIVSVERNMSRKKLLYFFLALGSLFSMFMIFNLYYRWPSESIAVNIVGNSIRYEVPLEHGLTYQVLYSLATLVPPLLSSFPWVWMIGAFNFVGALIAYYIFSAAFISVWCFFAAIVSFSLYGAFTVQKKYTERS